MADDDRVGSAPVALMSHGYAHARFGDPARAVGASIAVDRQAFRVVGVTPPGFFGVNPEWSPALYLPLNTETAPAEGRPSSANRDTAYWLDLMARLRPGVTRTEAGSSRSDPATSRRSSLGGAFAVLALLIACVGLCATVSYRVSRKTAEIGIRTALGASRAGVLWLVMRGVLGLVVAGLALGLPIAFVSSSLVERFLWGVEPHDPVALTVAVLVTLVSALVAAYFPARRGSRIDPVTALRYDQRARRICPLRATVWDNRPVVPAQTTSNGPRSDHASRSHRHD